MPFSTARPLALVTGANQGIGLAVAQSLARTHSYHVIMAARNTEMNEKMASELRAEGHHVSTVQLELTSLASIEAAVVKVEKDFGYLDVLVNNAGILVDHRPALTSWERFSQTFATNVIGTATLTDGLLPLLRKAKSGPPRIVFVTSVMGSLERSTDKTTAYYGIDYKAYDASKAAINMLMLNYSRILEDAGGKVNAACPGLVKTALTGYIAYGHSPEIGATRIVELATVGADGPTATLSDQDGPLPW